MQQAGERALEQLHHGANPFLKLRNRLVFCGSTANLRISPISGILVRILVGINLSLTTVDEIRPCRPPIALIQKGEDGCGLLPLTLSRVPESRGQARAAPLAGARSRSTLLSRRDLDHLAVAQLEFLAAPLDSP